MKAYVFFVPENASPPYPVDQINKVFLDRKKALNFWIYDYICYGVIDPDPEQVAEAERAFLDAERGRDITELDGACMQVLEVDE